MGLGLHVLTRYLWILLSVLAPFSKPLQCYLYLSCPVASMKLGRGLLWSSSLRCTFGSDPYMYSLVVSPGIYKQQVSGLGHFARLLLLSHIPCTFWGFEASFLVHEAPVNWPSLVHSAVHFLQLCSHVGPSDRRTERGVTVAFSPVSWDHCSCDLPSVFSCPWVPRCCCHCCLPYGIAWGLGYERTKARQNKRIEKRKEKRKKENRKMGFIPFSLGVRRRLSHALNLN